MSYQVEDEVIPARRYKGRLAVLLLGVFVCWPAWAQQSVTPVAPSRLVVQTVPQTVIWVDALRYGAVPERGELAIKNLRAGAHMVRARLKGKREITQPVTLAAGEQKSLRLTLTSPAAPAEQFFQNAEELRERGKHAEAIKEYQAALKLRPRGHAAARLGLARSLMANEDYDDALAQMRQALREAPTWHAEAHTIIGNIRRTQGFYDEAIASYRTALKLARNFSPEAHTGLALAYQDRNLAADAIKHLQLAIAQANDTEPIIYFLLGSSLEREYRSKEAVTAYEKYLELAPQSAQATAVRSVLKQLRRETR